MNAIDKFFNIHYNTNTMFYSGYDENKGKLLNRIVEQFLLQDYIGKGDGYG